MGLSKNHVRQNPWVYQFPFLVSNTSIFGQKSMLIAGSEAESASLLLGPLCMVWGPQDTRGETGNPRLGVEISSLHVECMCTVYWYTSVKQHRETKTPNRRSQHSCSKDRFMVKFCWLMQARTTFLHRCIRDCTGSICLFVITNEFYIHEGMDAEHKIISDKRQLVPEGNSILSSYCPPCSTRAQGLGTSLAANAHNEMQRYMCGSSNHQSRIQLGEAGDTTKSRWHFEQGRSWSVRG